MSDEVVPAAWTPERVARLTDLVASGASADAIAAALGGVTRNAVIGKCHRLGLALGVERSGAGTAEGRRQRAETLPAMEPEAKAAPRPKASPRPKPSSRPEPAPKPVPVEAARPKPEPPPLPPPPAVEPVVAGWPKPAGPNAVDIMGLTSRHCRMPLWANSARSGLFCGEPVARDGASYCAACAARVGGGQPRLTALSFLLARGARKAAA